MRLTDTDSSTTGNTLSLSVGSSMICMMAPGGLAMKSIVSSSLSTARCGLSGGLPPWSPCLSSPKFHQPLLDRLEVRLDAAERDAQVLTDGPTCVGFFGRCHRYLGVELHRVQVAA